jgi:hypothetical protein
MGGRGRKARQTVTDEEKRLVREIKKWMGKASLHDLEQVTENSRLTMDHIQSLLRADKVSPLQIRGRRGA